MYSNKQNINILTSLLTQHGVEQAVVCPGSRNAPIVHDLIEAGLRCIPVTDERAAAFYALGLAQAAARPVAVCVTSGSAVLNLLPGIAEAAFQHVPIIAITADRPAERIGQLDGQTLPQPGALEPYVALSVDIPEPHDSDMHVMCNRLINQALMACSRFPGAPVHINLRLSEPLMDCAVPRLPCERLITQVCPALADAQSAAIAIAQRLTQARRPMVVCGQMPPSPALSSALAILGESVPTLYEALASTFGGVDFDAVLQRYANMPDLQPDFVLYMGGTLVSKRLKQFLQGIPYCQSWEISADGLAHDTFKNLTGVIHGDAAAILPALAAHIDLVKPEPQYVGSWRQLLADPLPAPQSMSALAVAEFERQLQAYSPERFVTHYANSTAVRLANRYARHYVYCNRGVNGIEGCVSTAAGYSLATDANVYCVTGDLAFFYDSNALWCPSLVGNLRILLLNNGQGEIFDTLPGMPADGLERDAIMGTHSASAQGICQSFGVAYTSVSTPQELHAAIKWLLTAPVDRPMLLEVINKQ